MAKPTYSSFVFFSAGPVGDHAIFVDTAHRFYESTGKPSTLIVKHPNPFLSDMSLPYKDHIRLINVSGIKGYTELVLFSFASIWKKRCFVFFLPLTHPSYLKVYALYLRFFTRSRAVGLNLEGSRSFPVGEGSAAFLGEGNIIPSRLDKELFYEQANRLLTWLGYRAVSRVPELVYISHEEVFARHDITKKQYIVFHLCGSDAGKSLPKERWNHIFHVLRQKFPTTPFVFSGGPRDVAFIESCLGGLDRSLLYNLAGKVSLQELLTLYKEALVTVSVHTGNAILVNMLHVPTVMVNMKGVYMFKYHYNKHSIDLASTEGCECDPYERKCHDVIHGGIPYMSCIFTIKDEAIIDAVEKQIVAYK